MKAFVGELAHDHAVIWLGIRQSCHGDIATTEGKKVVWMRYCPDNHVASIE